MRRSLTNSANRRPGWFLPATKLAHRHIRCLRERTEIGRNRDFVDIWLSDLGVSRQHAVVRLTEESAEFYDLSEDNPSMINDRPVKGTMDLREGDRVQIGRLAFTFSYQPGG